MKKLETTVFTNGHRYEQLFSDEGHIYAYNQFDKETDELVGVEVFKAKVRKAETFYDVDYPEREVYPSNEDFGITAFTLSANSSFSRIKDKMEFIKNIVDNRKERYNKDESKG